MRLVERLPILRLSLAVFLLAASPPAARADDWISIAPDDLKMTSEPLAPGAPAIMLYFQVDRDDNGPSESIYARLKILTEEGRSFADTEIPYDKSHESISSIRARTVHADGRVIPFDGVVYDKPIAQARGVKLIAKSFTLPDVQVGSIIEYRLRHNFRAGWVFDSHWILSQELFTREAKFSLDPYTGYALRYSWPAGLPDGTAAPTKTHGRIQMQARNVPAFVKEEHMPPENELKYRVDFIYETDSDLQLEKDPQVFWQKFAKRAYSRTEDFIDRPRVMAQAVAQTVSAGDPAEAKLRKLYDRCQRIRNVDFEREKTREEQDRENQKPARNVEDVWTRGYGDGNQISWLYLALVRAAGIPADAVQVSTRDTHFFNANAQNANDLNSNVVLVTLDGKPLFLDPGIANAPFGMLPWAETAVKGLRLAKKGGTWVETPAPRALESRIERSGRLKLGNDGSLEGTVTVTYSGQEALWRRNQEREEDDTERKQFLEDQIKQDIPAGIEVTLRNRPDWGTASTALVAQYDLKVPGWAAGAGQRALLPVGLFDAHERGVFLHGTRVHPMYFNFPYQSSDHISIDLPDGWQVSSVPKAQGDDRGGFSYLISTEQSSGALRVDRQISVGGILAGVKSFPTVQEFFQTVRSGDEEQVILIAANRAGAH